MDEPRLLLRRIAALLALAMLCAVLLPAWYEARTLNGEITIMENEVARFDREVHSALAGYKPGPREGDLSLCLQLANAVDVAAGQPVVVYDEGGSVIGQGALGRAESVTDARREPSDAFTVCRLPFRVDEIRASGAVTIKIGARQSTLYASELDAQGWKLQIPVGS